MDKSSEKDVENKLRGILRSSSLIAPCLCDGNSLALDRRLHFLMKRAVVVGGGGEKICALLPAQLPRNCMNPAWLSFLILKGACWVHYNFLVSFALKLYNAMD